MSNSYDYLPWMFLGTRTGRTSCKANNINLMELPRRETKQDLLTKYAKSRQFRWVTHDGAKLRPKDMDSSHLFNCIKMMYNNVMPAQLRVAGFIPRNISSLTRNPAYMERAIFELTRELMRRSDYCIYEAAIDDMEFNLELWSRMRQGRIQTVIML